jgi:hypothetical protein
MTEKEAIAISGRAHELLRNNEFMADFFLAAAKKITAADLRAKHGVTPDELRSVVKIVRAQRNGTAAEERATQETKFTGKARNRKDTSTIVCR